MSSDADIGQGLRRRHGKAPGTLLFLAFFIYVAVPLLWLLLNSMKSNSALFSTFGFWLNEPPQLLANIQAVLKQSDGIFLLWMRNTFFYAGVSAIGAAAVSALAGYAFAAFDFAGKKLLFGVIVTTIMVPNTALAVPIFQIMTSLHVINTPWAMILPCLVNPFGVFLMYSYIRQSLPMELLDAGRVDGTSEFGLFWRIVVPIVSPGIATVALFVFVGTWNNFFLPLLVLTDPTLQPVTVGLAGWNAQVTNPGLSNMQYSEVITAALMSIIPLVIAFLLLQRLWRSGLTLGAVK